MTLDLRQLRDHILSGPRSVILQPLWQRGQDALIVADYAQVGGTGAKRGAFLTERGVLAVLGPIPGDAALTAIEAAAEAPGPLQSLLKRTIRILRDYAGEGLDMGDNGTRQMLVALQHAGILQEDAVAELLDYGERPWTRAEMAFGEGVVVTDSDIAAARRIS